MKINFVVLSACLSVLFSTALHAATVAGIVERVVQPYLLLKTSAGYETVKLIHGAALGNIGSHGQISDGGQAVEVEWKAEKNGVKHAVTLTRKPFFAAHPSIEIAPEQAATWHDLEAGPERHLMIDVRSTGEWEDGHVLRSLSVPFNDSLDSYKPFPDNRSQGIILYGANAQNDLVYRAAQRAIAGGYDKIKVYSGGFADWSRRRKPLGIVAAGAKRLIERRMPLLIVDVREAAEWRSGHIPGSISAPPGTFSPDMLSVRERNYLYPVLLVGYSEKDSMAAFSLKLWGMSYGAPVYLLEGGYSSWKAAGFPVVAGGISPAADDVTPDGEIGFKEFKFLWNRGQSQSAPLLLDLRDDDEPIAAGQIHIPFPELEERMKELPKDKEIVLYCYTGTRAIIGLHMLKNNGYRVRYLNRNIRVGKDGELL